MSDSSNTSFDEMPRWIWRAVAIFWTGFLATVVLRELWHSLYGLMVLLLVALFLSLAIEPGVNRLAARGWRRGSATAVILLGVFLMLVVFMAAIGALVGQQIADLLTYVRREWNHGAAPVTPGAVQAVRSRESSRRDAWTEPELLAIP